MDEKAYEQIAQRVRPEIETIARRFFTSLQMEDEIDDVVQEVLILLWRYRDRLDEVTRLEGSIVWRATSVLHVTDNSNARKRCPLIIVISWLQIVLRALLMMPNVCK